MTTPAPPSALLPRETAAARYGSTEGNNARYCSQASSGLPLAPIELVRTARPWSWALTSAGIARRRGFEAAAQGRSALMRSPSISTVWLFATPAPVSKWVQLIARIFKSRLSVIDGRNRSVGLGRQKAAIENL